MPYLNNEKDKVEVQKGESLVDAAEKLGVPFSCTEGNCGTCLTEVVSGMEHLQPLTEEEEMFGLHPHERLLCQVRFKSEVGKEDTVTIKT